ncbi:hypothetical protein D3C78_553640 [compost metagenome]
MGQAATGVDHLPGIHGEPLGVGGDGAAAVVQLALDVEVGVLRIAVLKSATAIGQLLCVERQLVGQLHLAGVVVELPGLYSCAAGDFQFALVVAQVAAADVQLAHAEVAAVVVQAGRGGQVDIAAGEDASAVVVEVAGNVQRAIGQWRNAGACLRLGAVSPATVAWRGLTAGGAAGCGGGGRGDQADSATVAVAGVRGAHGQVLGAGLLDGAAAVGQGLRVDLDPAGIERPFAVVEILRGVDGELASGAEGAGVGYPAAGGQAGVGLGLYGAGVLQAAIGGDDQLAGLGAEGTGVAHANAVLGPHHDDFLAVHAAQGANVQGEGRGVAAGSGLAHSAVVGADLVGAGGHLELLRPDSGVDLGRAGDQVGVVGGAGVQALAADLDGAAIDPVALQSPAIDHGRAGGEGRAIGVDEAAAVAGDTCRVGDDHLGPVAGHFDVAMQPARIAGVDLVEDYAGGALAHPRIALDPAAKLGLGVDAGVVEDGALLVDVELLVAVARYAGRAGRLDVDQRHAVGGLQHGGALPAGGARVGYDLRGSQGHEGHLAEGQPQGEMQGADGGDDAAATCRCATTGTAPMATGDFCYDLEQAQRPVEDDAVQVLVHVITSLVFV